MVYHVDDTIVAIASAPGGAARGVIRLSGPDSVSCLETCFEPNASASPPRRVATRIEGELHLNGRLGVVPCSAYVWPTQRSYTRQPTIEIHMVGAVPVLDAALRVFCASGARLAEPGEFTLCAFLAGRIDLPQAEAVLGVIDATGERQLDVALQQLAGGLSQTLNQARDDLLNLCADLEAGLDFVDEDLEFISADEVVRRLDLLRESLDRTLDQMASRGESQRAAKIVLRGRPNAGKSTLWNALVKDASAIVTSVPGTTRDYLEGEIHFDGTGGTLVDTAGVDPTASSHVDLASQAVTARQHRQADLTVLCLDGSEGIQTWDLDQLIASSGAEVAVLTKCDRLNPAWQRQSVVSSKPIGILQDSNRWLRISLPAASGPRVIELIKISAHTGDGLQDLRTAIHRQLEAVMTTESGVVASTAVRCHESLRCATDGVRRWRELAANSAGDELVAAEVRNALNELGKVVGAVFTDDVLDRVFSRFCIGK